MAQYKKPIGVNVLEAARERISWAFDAFPKLYVSFSAGKDSTTMLHLVMDEAVRRGRKVGVLLIDLEGQYRITIEHGLKCCAMYEGHIDLHWVCLPIHLRNAVSVFETHWLCWDPERKKDWVRQPPKIAITDPGYFPFFKPAMEFEEFVPEFGRWYGNGEMTGCFVGIRSDESLNRYRTVAGHGTKLEGRNYTNFIGGALFNIYPIYDWKTEDVWTYHGRYPEKPYNGLYDLMHRAGLSIHQMRICQPYGDDQRRGLWLFHIIEPETWSRVVARVNGANGGAMYANETGNISGYRAISCPEGHTWQSFAELLLESMPPATQEHYKNKIAVFIQWYRQRGYPHGIPDEGDRKLEEARKVPSWRRVCKALLRNDYWCKGLSFSQHKSAAYEKYLKVMKKRREKWGII